MRAAFINSLMQFAHGNEKVILLSGDLGFSVFEEFRARYPKQFLNLGVGEANIIGVAAGLAHEGFIPIVYSIIPFITMRCYEQIRNDICSHDVNVKIVGVGSGLGYAHLGISHHAAEDVGIMRTLPNMRVLSPADGYEVEACLTWAFATPHPMYIRLGKKGEPNVHSGPINFSKKRQFIIKEGTSAVLFCTGTIVFSCLEAAKILQQKNISVRVVSIPIIKPLDSAQILTLVQGIEYVFTSEEHSIIGGLGSSIAEVLLENNVSLKGFKRIGITDTFCRVIGSYDYMRNAMGLSPAKIAQQILSCIKA